ncbi:MAG: Spy/CpxP family protein refolding chaperone [bacterium]|nr:Spy/CpxP family protein refolding chaperone [bacterium]
MLKKLSLGILILGLLIPALSFAQPPPPPDRDSHRNRMGKHRRADVEARVRTMKVWKMTEEMNLTEDQAAKFFPLQNDMERKLDDLDGDRQVKMLELENEVWKEKPDGKKINDLLNALENLEKQHLDLRLKFRQDVKGILSPEQMGKMALFHDRFPGMMRDAIESYQKARGMGRPDGPPPCDPDNPNPGPPPGPGPGGP